MVRAKDFVEQLDVIVYFVSSVINNIEELEEKKDDFEMKDLFGSDDEDDDDKKSKKLSRYVNPLTLYDSKGKQEEDQKLDLDNKVGYLFDAVLQVPVEGPITFKKGSDKLEDHVKDFSYKAIKGDAEVEEIPAVIPINTDLITFNFEYNLNGIL